MEKEMCFGLGEKNYKMRMAKWNWELGRRASENNFESEENKREDAAIIVASIVMHSPEKSGKCYSKRPKYFISDENLCPKDLRYLTNSAVVNTFTINCSLKCMSSDHIGILFIDSAKARYSLSSLSEISSLAFIKNISNCSFGTVVILDFNSSISSSSFSVESPDSSSTRDLCSFSSSKIYSGAYNSNLSENIISFVTPVPVKAINNSTASITNFINISYLSFGYNFLYLRCNDLFNSFPSFKAFSSDNLDSDTISLNFLYCSSSDSFLAFLANSSAALANTNPSLLFNLEGMSIFIVISSIGEQYIIGYLNLFRFLLIEIKMGREMLGSKEKINKIKLEDSSVHAGYSKGNLEDRGNLEKAFLDDSILRCGILNQTMANISSLENSRKSSSLVTNTLDSDLENLANLPFDSPFGFDIILTPCSLRNFSNLSSTFSSERNLIGWDVDDNILFASCNICCVLEGCHDMFFSQGGECFKDFFKGSSIFEHLENLPDHDSSAFESRHSTTDFTVNDNIFINLNSHNFWNACHIFKDFGNLDKMGRKKWNWELGRWNSNYLDVLDKEKKDNEAFDLASEALLVMHNILTDYSIEGENNYINFSINNGFGAEDAPEALSVMQRLDEPRLDGLPGSTPGWGASALSERDECYLKKWKLFSEFVKVEGDKRGRQEDET